MSNWGDYLEYPICGGQGWTAALLYFDEPDHAFTPGENPLECAVDGHTEAQHVLDGDGSDVWRIFGVRVLNMTTSNHRVEVGDARTQNASAWTTPWMAPDAEIAGTDYQVPPGTWLYMSHDGIPYRVRCS